MLLERIGLAGDREEVKDASAVVVEQHDREREAQPVRRQEPSDVVGERHVADEEDGGGTGRGEAERRGDRSVDSVRAAVRERARAVHPSPHKRLGVPDRHRGGHEQRRPRIEPLAEPARHQRL